MSAELIELAERVEAATGRDRMLDAEIHVARYGFPDRAYAQAMGMRPMGQPETEKMEWLSRWGVLPFTASLDAAMTLLPEGWGGNVNWPIGRNHGPYETNLGSPEMRPAFVVGIGALPALSFAAAALRARAALQPVDQEGGEP